MHFLQTDANTSTSMRSVCPEATTYAIESHKCDQTCVHYTTEIGGRRLVIGVWIHSTGNITFNCVLWITKIVDLISPKKKLPFLLLIFFVAQIANKILLNKVLSYHVLNFPHILNDVFFNDLFCNWQLFCGKRSPHCYFRPYSLPTYSMITKVEK